MKIFGYRKALFVVLFCAVASFALYIALQAILKVDSTKAAWISSITGAFFAFLGTLSMNAFRALRGSYERDAAIGVAKCQSGDKLEK